MSSEQVAKIMQSLKDYLNLSYVSAGATIAAKVGVSEFGV